MKKHVWSIVLTLAMVAALVPATLLTASAAVAEADSNFVISTSDVWIKGLTISTPSKGTVKATFIKPENTTGAPATLKILAWGPQHEVNEEWSTTEPVSDDAFDAAYGGRVGTPLNYTEDGFQFTVPDNGANGYNQAGGVEVYIGYKTNGDWTVGKFTLPQTGKLPTAQCTITWDLNYTGAPAATPAGQDQGER